MANKIADDVLCAARAEAGHQLANRERRDGLRAMFDALLRARNFLDETCSDSHLVAPGKWAVRIIDQAGYDEAQRFGEELKRIDLELKTYSTYVIVKPARGEAFDRLGKMCALDGEGLDDALRRILLERGASTYQIRETLYYGDDSKRTAADRAKRARLRQLSAVHAATESLVERHLPASSRTGWERHGAGLETKIGNLSADRKTTRNATPKKRKSSSRKRR